MTVDLLLRHPLFVALITLGVGAALAYFGTERWQRWRQRRDFQYRTLVKLSELSYDLMDRLSELLVKRRRMAPETYEEKRREMVARWTIFASMRPEVIACYGRAFVLGEDYQEMVNALNRLREHARATEPVAPQTFVPEQEKFLAYREAVVAEMAWAMGLVSRRDYRAEIEGAQQRVREATRQDQM